MRFLSTATIVAVLTITPAVASAQLPPGYWSYYDSGNKNYHRQHSHHELHRQQAPPGAAYEPWVDRGSPVDPMDYEGRGMTGRGLSAYQSNGYTGPNQNNYYGYWDGGYQPGTLYGYSMYPHFDRPGFTYWQN